MPLYFFHIRQADNSLVCDDEGSLFEDMEGARNEAVASILDIAADAARSGQAPLGVAIEIADETGKTLRSVRPRDIFN